MKELLIEKCGEDICFTYPRHRTKSQMFYSRPIPSESFVETIRSKNIYKKCANALKEECFKFNFELSDSFCDADDLDKSYECLENNIPESCDLFFKNLFNSYNKSGHQKRKALIIFQIACYNINNGTVKTLSGNENVPLPPSVVPGNLVQAAIENFDHEEGTPSRISGSHDTIMVIF